MEAALTGVAVIVAVISAYVAHLARGDASRAAAAAEASAKAAREYTDIEAARRTDELVERAEAVAAAGRANVTTVALDGRLVVRNDGPAVARNVRFIPTDDSAVFWAPDSGNVLGETFDLRKDERRSQSFSAYAHRRPLIAATLEWTDADGPHVEHRAISTL